MPELAAPIGSIHFARKRSAFVNQQMPLRVIRYCDKNKSARA
jgi:hypothetical protein